MRLLNMCYQHTLLVVNEEPAGVAACGPEITSIENDVAQAYSRIDQNRTGDQFLIDQQQCAGREHRVDPLPGGNQLFLACPASQGTPSESLKRLVCIAVIIQHANGQWHEAYAVAQQRAIGL